MIILNNNHRITFLRSLDGGTYDSYGNRIKETQSIEVECLLGDNNKFEEFSMNDSPYSTDLVIAINGFNAEEAKEVNEGDFAIFQGDKFRILQKKNVNIISRWNPKIANTIMFSLNREGVPNGEK